MKIKLTKAYRFIIVYCLSFILQISILPAQTKQGFDLKLKTGTLNHISIDLHDLPHVEPVIAVNPEDPEQIVVAAMVIHEPKSNQFHNSWEINVFVSENGGESWLRRKLPGLDGGLSGDPWLAWAENGTLYLTCLARLEGSDSSQLKAWLFESKDGGYSWSEPREIHFEEKHNGWTDHPVAHPVGEELYIFATGPFSSISTSRFNNNRQGFEAFPAFKPDDRNNLLGSGVAFQEDSFLFNYYSVSAGSQPSELWVVGTNDNGQNYQRSIITSEHIPIVFPMMAVDRSNGPRHDRAYAVWTRSFERPHVMIGYSDDNGASWSQPKRVHIDSTSALRVAPNIAVSNEGLVAVVWVDGRYHEELSSDQLRRKFKNESSEFCWDVYATVSDDGGHNFLPGIRLTPETTCSITDKNGLAGKRWSFGGDYIGVTWDTEDNFHPVWIDSRTGVYQVWTVKVEVKQDR